MLQKHKDRYMKKTLSLFAIIFAAFTLSGCYSIFSGGSQGTVVDAESTTNPKAGIPNVDVYFYTEESQRNKDFDAWTGDTVFESSASFHTTTDSDGNFTLSKIYWKTNKPAYGKDADTTKCFLLFYHENYGLVKGDTVIVSDSLTSNITQELKKIRTSTDIDIRLIDVGSNQYTANTLKVTIKVPQGNGKDKTFERDITGRGTITVNYPRDTNPKAAITYKMSGTETWKACYNNDAANTYSFKTDSTMEKTISGSTTIVECYGKSTRIYVPNVNGTTTNPGTQVNLKAEYNTNILDCGNAYSAPQTLGNSSTQINTFSFTNTGLYWEDTSYTTANVDIDLTFTPAPVSPTSNPLTVKNTDSVVNVNLN